MLFLKTNSASSTRTRLALKLGTLAVASLGGLLAGEAHAANPCLAIAPATCDFTGGNFQVTDFSFTGFTPTATDYITYTLSGSDLQPQLTFVPGRNSTITGSISYKITLTGGYNFATAQSNITGNNGTFSTSTTSTGLPTSADSTGGPGTTVSFTPGLTSQIFTQSFSATPSGSLVANSLGSIYSIIPGTVSEVPGPLPILGAGAAFGFSRRLRHRIKVAA
jgi:hypothetical protein